MWCHVGPRGAMWCHVVPWSVGVCGAIVCWRMWCHSVWAVVRYSACGAIVCGAIVCCGVMCGAVVQCIPTMALSAMALQTMVTENDTLWHSCTPPATVALIHNTTYCGSTRCSTTYHRTPYRCLLTSRQPRQSCSGGIAQMSPVALDRPDLIVRT